MTQKMKVIIGLVIFVMIIAGATISYNVLSQSVEAENSVDLTDDKLGSDADVAGDKSENSTGETIKQNDNDADVAMEENEGDVALAEEAGSVEEAEDDKRRQAPDFIMEDSAGNSVNLSDMIGNDKPIVLNFWASWCPPCKMEMPDFDAVYQELGDEVQFMMINMTDGQRETVEIGTQYIEEQGFLFPIYFDINQEGAMNYRIYSIPTTIFIDKDGYMVTGAQGAIDEETLRRGIDMIR